MKGFDGDPERAAALRARLEGLLDVFPKHLPKTKSPTWFDAGELARNDQFDAILRAHKKDRLTVPIQALRMTGAPYHGFLLMHPRRLAWFVPSLLASWLDRAPGPGSRPFDADDIDSIVRDVGRFPDEDQAWTDEESEALAAFFEAALAAALATPLGPERDREHAPERPLEDGIRVWSLRSPSIPLSVLSVARALHADVDALAVQWAQGPSELALDHLLEAVFDTTIASKHYLSHEAVADRLGEAFFEATGERQIRLSKAEKAVRRNIARREEV